MGVKQVNIFTCDSCRKTISKADSGYTNTSLLYKDPVVTPPEDWKSVYDKSGNNGKLKCKECIEEAEGEN